jgi:hypothetical protein
MNKRAPNRRKTSRRAEAIGTSDDRQSQNREIAEEVVKEKDEMIKCASPPCYLSEIED